MLWVYNELAMEVVGRVLIRDEILFQNGMDVSLWSSAKMSGTIVVAPSSFVLLTDHLGSTRAKFNAQNQVTARWDYEPFGGELFRAGVAGYGATDLLTHRFTGKERDPETINSNNPSGLDYFGARYFGASLGRFTSADAPFADQRPEDPQSWNLYGYVRSNPLRFIDPTGRECIDGVTSGYGEESLDGQACFSATGTADVAIRNPYFNAVAHGVNQAAPVVRTLAVATAAVPAAAAICGSTCDIHHYCGDRRNHWHSCGRDSAGTKSDCRTFACDPEWCSMDGRNCFACDGICIRHVPRVGAHE
jgi:RHS repeat-associated protein